MPKELEPTPDQLNQIEASMQVDDPFDVTDLDANDEVGIFLKQLEEIHPLTFHTREEDAYWAHKMKDPDPEIARNARDEFLYSCIKIVVKEARKRQRDSTPIMDLVHEGIIGLYHAADRYNPEKGKFTTYANWWIINYQNRTVHSFKRPYHITVQVDQDLTKIKKFQMMFMAEHGHEPTKEQLASMADLSPHKVGILLDIEKQKNTSLNAHEPDENDELGDRVTGDLKSVYESSRDFEDQVDYRLFGKKAAKEFKKLSKNQSQALYSMLGLDPNGDWKPNHLTLEEAGEIIGVTRERVRQLIIEGTGQVSDPEVRKVLLRYFFD